MQDHQPCSSKMRLEHGNHGHSMLGAQDGEVWSTSISSTGQRWTKSQGRRAERALPSAVGAAQDTKGMAKMMEVGRAHKTMRCGAQAFATFAFAFATEAQRTGRREGLNARGSA